MDFNNSAPSSCKAVPLAPDQGDCKIVQPAPLPGVIIFVHGVNSDGEWYTQAEKGLCKGLNTRLGRGDGQMAHPGAGNGELHPASYSQELTDAGFLNPERDANTFIDDSKLSFSPVIRFRWGYKASQNELKSFGKELLLNEQNYWGGGPFQNGCSSLPDLWGEGLHDRLLLWLHAQHLNPAPERDVFGCPSRAYFVHACLRLAKLFKSIRDIQADCPITVVCHSQGNMIGLGAAFLAARMNVYADSYVLCNPPYSVKDGLFMDTYSQRYSGDDKHGYGRQTREARIRTLANFFEMVGKRAAHEPPSTLIDKAMKSKTFNAELDRNAYGINEPKQTYGRVTLYCNPHDQVISASPIQGIGWCGMRTEDITAANGEKVFRQRVFAQAYKVGVLANDQDEENYYYHYIDNHWDKQAQTHSKFFWYPQSPLARYSFSQGWEASGPVGKFFTLLTTPILYPLLNIPRAIGVGFAVNEIPDKSWKIPINAPALPEPFQPVTIWYGKEAAQFDQGFDPAGAARNTGKKEHSHDDPYDTHQSEPVTQAKEIDPKTNQQMTDEARGDRDSEAQMRYEDHARLRMKARLSGRVEPGKKAIEEDSPESASEDYKVWRKEQIIDFLQRGINQHATDHSTIVTNPMHAEKSITYDVAIGICDHCKLNEKSLRQLRIEADWRYAQYLSDDHPQRYLSEYFKDGTMEKKELFEWVKGGEASMPEGDNAIVNQRDIAAVPNRERESA